MKCFQPAPRRLSAIQIGGRKTKAALEPILMERFSHQDFDFCFCFRCLDRDSGWVSKARLSKNDS